MASKLSIKSIFDTDKIIYIAPILVLVSFFHVFSYNTSTHRFGIIEILFALIFIGYYLWEMIAVIYAPEIIWKKRIEAVICIAIGILLVPFPPLMTWQYYNLYKNSDRYSFNKQIIAAIITAWLGISALFYSSYTHFAERMAAQNASVPESSYVAPTQGQ
jgi:hypothetical protein